MGTCPPPCDSSQNGVCAEHGGITRCWAIRSLRELRNLLDDCDRVRFIPGTGELTLVGVQELIESMGGYRLEELAGGVIEIRRRGVGKRQD
jgi:hypothetical protein